VSAAADGLTDNFTGTHFIIDMRAATRGKRKHRLRSTVNRKIGQVYSNPQSEAQRKIPKVSQRAAGQKTD